MVNILPFNIAFVDFFPISPYKLLAIVFPRGLRTNWDDNIYVNPENIMGFISAISEFFNASLLEIPLHLLLQYTQTEETTAVGNAILTPVAKSNPAEINNFSWNVTVLVTILPLLSLRTFPLASLT